MGQEVVEAADGGGELDVAWETQSRVGDRSPRLQLAPGHAGALGRHQAERVHVSQRLQLLLGERYRR